MATVKVESIFITKKGIDQPNWEERTQGQVQQFSRQSVTSLNLLDSNKTISHLIHHQYNLASHFQYTGPILEIG